MYESFPTAILRSTPFRVPPGLSEERTGNLLSESHAASAVDASCHDCLDKGPQVLVLHRALHLSEAAAVRAEVHRLVLQVALSALVADGAIQRVVDLHAPQQTG